MSKLPPQMFQTVAVLPSKPTRRIPLRWADFGREFSALRQKHDLSARDIARFLDASPARITDLERGFENDPDFILCPECDTRDWNWRACKYCGGMGYVRKERS